ncbi:MAG: hypothetical protein WCK39_03860 [Methanomassiliicoccales archaeon]
MSINSVNLQFGKELARIANSNIRGWTHRALFMAPEAFWSEPSSKSGKYHPEDERGDQGLLTHTKRASEVLETLLDSAAGKFDANDQDVMRSAILIHDLCSCFGKSHPLMVRGYLFGESNREFVNDPCGAHIIDIASRHMGRWGCDRPDSEMAWFVHYADNIAAKLHIFMATQAEPRPVCVATAEEEAALCPG